MRFDVNVSVRPAGSDELRTRTELKNMNSFNFAAKGIEREIARQTRIYEEGGVVDQETLHFDPAHEESPPMRSKEEAQDYRYFPEPDLVPVQPPADVVERLRGEIADLPGARILRIADSLSFYDADVLVTGGLDRLWADVVEAGADPEEAANVLANQFVAAGIDPGAVDARELAKLVSARAEIRAPRSTRRSGRWRSRASAPTRTSRRKWSPTSPSSTRSSSGSSRRTPPRQSSTGAANRASSASSSAR